MENDNNSPTTSLVTADDFYNMPTHGGYNELVRGKLVPTAPNSTKTGLVIMQLAVALGNFMNARQLGTIFAARTGFALSQNPDTVRAPDVAFVAQSRIPEEGVPETGFWAIAPDLVAEVVSPNDRMTEIQDKVVDYLAAGVRLVWVVDPKTETVTVYQSLKQGKVLIADDALAGEDVLPGFELSLKKLFS
jgi:Uma2 family endonuclease